MPLRTTADDPPIMNMIPMIDIMFNLVIFLMVGTEFATSERNIALRVPEVVDQKTALTTPPERQVVNVFRSGKITLNDEECGLEELSRKLEAKRSQYQALGRVGARGSGSGVSGRGRCPQRVQAGGDPRVGDYRAAGLAAREINHGRTATRSLVRADQLVKPRLLGDLGRAHLADDRHSPDGDDVSRWGQSKPLGSA